jgi:hypothetical protein
MNSLGSHGVGVQVSGSAPNNAAVPGRPGGGERAAPRSTGLDSNERAIRLTQPERGMNEVLPRAVLDGEGPESHEPRKLPAKHRLGDERGDSGRNPEAHGFSRGRRSPMKTNGKKFPCSKITQQV